MPSLVLVFFFLLCPRVPFFSFFCVSLVYLLILFYLCLVRPVFSFSVFVFSSGHGFMLLSSSQCSCFVIIIFPSSSPVLVCLFLSISLPRNSFRLPAAISFPCCDTSVYHFILLLVLLSFCNSFLSYTFLLPYSLYLPPSLLVTLTLSLLCVCTENSQKKNRIT